MRRSTGITVTAVLAFVGGGFTVLVALGTALMSVLMSNSRASYALPRSFLLLAVVYYSGAAFWAIATGVGLLRLREWSRISQLIFSTLLVLGAIGTVSVMFFIHFPAPPTDANPAFTAQIMSGVKVATVIFYGMLGALGAWWLYYFNTSSIRAQFRVPRFIPAPAFSAATTPAFNVPPGTPADSFILPPPATTSTRPVSISVIAVLLLVGSAMMPLSLLYRAPVLLFGFLVSGWRAYVIVALLGLANLAAGVALLKLKPWARILAICVVTFSLLNILLTVFLPGSQSRWDQAMQVMINKWRMPAPITMPHLPVWLMLLSAVPIALAELYFLITQKPAFSTQPQNHLSAQ
jgi:hypothetical protein